METRILNIPAVGEVELQKNAIAKRLRIKILNNRRVVVVVPKSFSFSKAETIVLENKNWISDNLNKIQIDYIENPVFDENTVYSTKFHQLVLVKHEKGNLRLLLKNGKLHIFYPQFANVEDDKIQIAVKNTIEETLRLEAKKTLPKRLDFFANKFGYEFKNIRIKKMKSRWGSCSYTNNINLSLYLMQLPDKLIDYVLLHELVHTKVKNHSSEFWKKLGEHIESPKKLRLKLRNYPTEIFIKKDLQ